MTIKNYNFKAGLPQEFEILEITDLYNGFSETLTSPHRAEFYHIFWFQSADAVHLVDFTPVPITSDTILFLNKDIVQKFDENGKFTGKVLLFTENFFSRTEGDIKFLRNSILFNDLYPISQIRLQNKSIFADIIAMMETELSYPNDILQPEILHNLLHNLLLVSERERRSQGFSELKKSIDLDYLILFRDELENNFKNLKMVSSYAELLSVTERRLNQATSKVLGKSPKQMIDERILLEAKRLLTHTSNNVKEIGFELGFDEPTNFIKYFRKHSSCTPIEFREKFFI